ncbi:hypothetical protein RJ639_013636 [Escallonia herrerae]|uniref:Protein FLX-like 3 n=1 Tax=Escallonia herrerae TaxID=1293975 RepID=A0AA88VK81_9ASTE|nr:hypothetical protein RJ639_013636 [Escallonia herrerae]
MAGRNRMPRQPDSYRGSRDGPRPMMHRGPGPFPPHPAVLEEELEFQRRDIQKILADNAHVVDENVILQREITEVKEEIHRLGQVIPKLHAEKDAQARELIDRGLKLEAELHATEPLRAEVLRLKSEADKLSSLRQDLSAQVQTLTKDITRLKSENQQLSSVRSDIDAMHKELVEARRVFEYEKKANAEQLEQKLSMEKNLVSMAREIEKLRGEQLSGDRRSRGIGSGSYGMLSGSPERRYSGGAYGDVYGAGAWGPYDNHVARHEQKPLGEPVRDPHVRSLLRANGPPQEK